MMEETDKPSSHKLIVRSMSSGSDSGIDVNVSSKSSSKHTLLNTYVPNHPPDTKQDQKIKLDPSRCRIEECTSTQSEQLPEIKQDTVTKMKNQSLGIVAEDVDTSMISSNPHTISTLHNNLSKIHQVKSKCSSDVHSYQDISEGDILDSPTDDDMDESVSQSNVPLIGNYVSVPNISDETVNVKHIASDGYDDGIKMAEKLDSDSGFSACSPSNTSVVSTKDVTTIKKERYKRTADALQGSGLMDVTMKTAELLKKNRALQKEIEQFKKESSLFLEKVLNNPENADLRDLLEKEKEKTVAQKKIKLSTSTLTRSKTE